MTSAKPTRYTSNPSVSRQSSEPRLKHSRSQLSRLHPPEGQSRSYEVKLFIFRPIAAPAVAWFRAGIEARSCKWIVPPSCFMIIHEASRIEGGRLLHPADGRILSANKMLGWISPGLAEPESDMEDLGGTLGRLKK